MRGVRNAWPVTLACAMFVGLDAAVLFAGASPDLLLATPFFVLLIPLLLGRYVGEERIARLREVFAPRPLRAPARVPAPRRRGVRAIDRSRLLTTVHASRPPPAAALLHL